MSLAKTLVTIGNWIEKHFPEKITAAEIEHRVQCVESALGQVARANVTQDEVIANLVARVVELEKKNELFTSDMNKTKIMLLTQRQTAGR